MAGLFPPLSPRYCDEHNQTCLIKAITNVLPVKKKCLKVKIRSKSLSAIPEDRRQSSKKGVNTEPAELQNLQWVEPRGPACKADAPICAAL